MNRENHQREHEPGGQHAVAERRPLKQIADDRHVADRVDEEGLDIGLHHRPEIINAPDAVDDRGNSGEKLDCHANGPAQRQPAELGEEDRDPKADRNRDQHGDHRRHQGTVDRRRRAEFLLGRTPGVGEQKADAEFAESRPRADEQRDHDSEQENKNEDRRAERKQPESGVGEFQPGERAGAVDRRGAGGARGLERGCGHRWFQLCASPEESTGGRRDGEPPAPPADSHFCWTSLFHIASTSLITLSGIGI